ncbi:antibiotic ABC transporter ATP-binding protein [Candidatus Marinamargulisbacteria bacterium SCGC AG-343-D04]|nr:antibiotic ABC transporter ATP-binding protein [Candidatus Marinamargulisbacteria bacterium SCGC AG-343-D04]
MQKDKKYLLNYWSYIKRYKFLLALGFFLIPLISFFHILQPYLVKKAIDDAILVKDFGYLYLITVFFAVCVLFDFISKTLQGYIFQYIGQKTIMEIRRDLFSHVLHLSSSYYDKTPIGVVANRLTSDMESLNDSFASGLVTLLSDILTLVGIIVVMFVLSPKLTLVTLLIVPPMIFVVNFFRIKLRYFYNQIRGLSGKLHAYIQENLQGVSILQVFHHEKESFSEFSGINNRYMRATLSSVSYDAILYSLIESVNSIMIALMIWYGWGQYNQDFITLGLLVAFVDYIHKFFMPLKEISTKFAILQHALAALEKIFSTFEIHKNISSGPARLESVKGRILFQDVSFQYPSDTQKKILNSLSFQVNPGETIAFVGPTGSGKTTILRLLSRLYEGYEGNIFLDGEEIKQIDLNDLRDNIAVVNQDSTLFSDTIRFNITLNKDSISEEKMIWAAKRVYIHDFIMSLPNGYDTVLEKGNQSISLGQAQLISFARALASPSPIILLDEATASVDSLLESKIQKALLKLFKSKTSLVVAHRLSTIRHAQHIIALKEGQIVESGSHRELLAKKGFYSNLYRMQFANSLSKFKK